MQQKKLKEEPVILAKMGSSELELKVLSTRVITIEKPFKGVNRKTRRSKEYKKLLKAKKTIK